MNSVKQFQELMNISDNQRFISWGIYRKEVTNYLISIISDNTVNSCILFGAGNSDDIDLSLLLKYIPSIALSDIDSQALKNAIKKYNLEDDSYSMIPMDYLGLNNNKDWNNFVSNIVKLNKKDLIETYLNKIKDAVLNYHFKTDVQYDLIIVSPIYTQLFLNQGLSYISILNNLNFPEELLRFIQDSLLNFMSDIINRFNEDLLSCANKNSTVIVLSDVFETNLDSDFYRKAKNSKSLEVFYKEYADKYGVGLGDFGLINLDEKLNKKSTRWFEWSFNKTRRLFVKVNEYKK
ncbi:MAG: hypothetical protein KAH13_01930 [Tenericutes bacterium]|nr:hypothetical protein [Mycoplasmatota bacterium]